jgi:hypothetical protein
LRIKRTQCRIDYVWTFCGMRGPAAAFGEAIVKAGEEACRSCIRIRAAYERYDARGVLVTAGVLPREEAQ